MKKNISTIWTLFIFLTAFFTSCGKSETIIEEPVIVTDKGDRLLVNDDLILLLDQEMTHSGLTGVLWDSAASTIQVDKSAIEMDLDTGLVIHISRESDALVKKIKNVQLDNGLYTLQVVQASLLDIFDNVHARLDFSTDYSSRIMKSKSLNSLNNEDLGIALTDDKNGIHPSEVRMRIGNQEKVIFSVKNDIENTMLKAPSSTQSDRVGHDFNIDKDLTLFSVKVFSVILRDFGLSFWTDMKADIHHDLGITSGNASFVATASNIDISGYFDIDLEASAGLPLINENDPLLLPLHLQFEFIVGGVPVFIGVELAVDLGVEISLDGALKIGSGYTFEYNIPEVKVGMNYKYWTTYSWTGPHFHTHTDLVHEFKKGSLVKSQMNPLRLEAMASITQKYTIKPTIGFSIYDIAGPELDFAVGNQFDFDIGGGVSVDVTEKNSTPEVYIGWDSKLASEVGVGGGVWLDIMGVVNKHLDIPTLPVIPSLSIWHTPGNMINKTNTDFSATVVNVSKEMEVQVEDSWGLPSPGMFVEWVSPSGGHWEKPITLALTGTVKNKWIPTSVGKHKPYCYLKKGNLKEVKRIVFETTTTAQ